MITVYGLIGFWSSGPKDRLGLSIGIAFVAICAAVFFYSSRSRYGSRIQIATVAVIAFPTLYFGDQKVFGVMVLFVAFALCVAYGCYNKRRNLRLGITAAVVYAVLVLCNREINLMAFPRAAVWLVFMIFLALIFWTVFRDYMEREVNTEAAAVRKLIQVNRQLLELAKDLKSSLDQIKG